MEERLQVSNLGEEGENKCPSKTECQENRNGQRRAHSRRPRWAQPQEEAKPQKRSAPGWGRQHHSQRDPPFVPRKRLPDWYFPWLRRSLGMKEVKSERERGSRRRHRDGDMVAIAPAVVVKQERLSPESAPPVHRRPDSSCGSPSPPAGESGRPSHRGNRARGGSR